MSSFSPSSSQRKILIASHNDGKVREIKDLLAEFPINIVSAKEFQIPEPEETETSFAGNAKLKAEFCAQYGKISSLADDSGLCIHALDNEPHIYSARLAKEQGGFVQAMHYLHERLTLKNSQNFSAHFTCALAFADYHQASKTCQTQIFEGEIHGNFCFPPRGKNGFGYDPIFIADGYEMSFGEMHPEDKHAISHRARAFEKLKTYLKNWI